MIWSLLVFLIVAEGLVIGQEIRDRFALNDRRHRLGTLQLACKFYAHDHGDAMPPDLRAVFPRYLNSESYLAYAMNEVDYFPGLTDANNPASLLLQEKKADWRGRRWIGTLDQSLELRQELPPVQPVHP